MKFIIPILCCFTTVVLFSKTDSTAKKNADDDMHIIYSFGCSYQNEFLAEAGLMYGWSAKTGPCNPGGMAGIKLASEFNFSPNNFYIAPKISAQADLIFLALRVNIIDYTDFTHHDIKITPEIGITLLGHMDIMYGYNIPTAISTIPNISTHRVTLTFNFDDNLSVLR